MKVHLYSTGVANRASVAAALARAGADVREARGPDDVAAAERLVVPGVGAFAEGRAALQRAGLDAALAARVRAGRPTLAICLGFQLLCAESAEAPGVPGLGALPGALTRFEGAGLRVPQLGWNRVEPGPGTRLVEAGEAWFAHSYRLLEPPPGWEVATSEHGGTFVAALERGDALLCQFHPELSGAWGARLIARWLAGGATC